jgi:hypothetical protein
VSKPVGFSLNHVWMLSTIGHLCALRILQVRLAQLDLKLASPSCALDLGLREEAARGQPPKVRTVRLGRCLGAVTSLAPIAAARMKRARRRPAGEAEPRRPAAPTRCRRFADALPTLCRRASRALPTRRQRSRSGRSARASRARGETGSGQQPASHCRAVQSRVAQAFRCLGTPLMPRTRSLSDRLHLEGARWRSVFVFLKRLVRDTHAPAY